VSRSHRVYVATRFPRAAHAAEVAGLLRRAGHRVTSTWHDGGESPGDEHDPARRAAIRARNERDLRDADALLLLVAPGLAGALVEAAWAHAWGHRVVAVGTRFDVTLMLDLPAIEWVDTVEDAVAALGRAPARRDA
jgi:hypothetical protein